MVTENIIFQKDKGDTDLGYVYVNFKERGQSSKRVSTKIKINRKYFDDFKNDELPTFNPTKEFDYQSLNQKIVEIITGNSLPKSATDDYIVYFKTWMDTLLHGGTRTTYRTVYNRLVKDFPDGLKFAEMNSNWFFSYTKNLRTKHNLSQGYTRFTMATIIHACQVANDDDNLNIDKIHFKISKLKLKNNENATHILLNDADVNQLLEYKYNTEHPNRINKRRFEYISFGLCQLFGMGARFSDMLLLRHGNFTKECIYIQLPKTKKYKQIPYSIMLLTTMYKYIHRESKFTLLELERIGNYLNEQEKLKWLRDSILEYVSEYRPEAFFFRFVPKELWEYDSAEPFNDEQFAAFSRARTLYNTNLRQYSIDHDFGFSLSSHAFRYKFVANCREQKIGIYEISKMLGHSRISTTENYIKKHFGFDDSLEIMNVVDRKYIK
ncbi:site-specific integrase [Flavobacterium sp. AC]|uniref:Site-specific integrase n=1 Tax=Flavobacterium azizsancarii TaxID=2961580 RepID=A0ABT4W8T4_9FLAO|nr:site-specific integrase [Flavobacterium azizsancarii]MDA6068939.1 site-specific integrase [Flavobacterium azizsancarii]